MTPNFDHEGGGDRDAAQPFSGRPGANAFRPAPPRSRLRKVMGSIGWLFGGGREWAGVAPIRRGFSLIGELARGARDPSPPRERVHLNEDRSLDLQATAFSLGITVPALRARLEARRRETARLAYFLFGLGVLGLGWWLRSAPAAPLTGSRILLVIDFLPFCVLFFLLGFYQALLNYQIRSGRRVGWREYLMAEDGILPR